MCSARVLWLGLAVGLVGGAGACSDPGSGREDTGARPDAQVAADATDPAARDANADAEVGREDGGPRGDAEEAGPDASRDASAPDAARCARDPTPDALEIVPAWSQRAAANDEGSHTLCDLDRDGRLEVILNVSVADQPGEGYLLVADAITGEPLWQTRDGTSSFAYPYCTDTNGDGVDDVLVGGRITDVVAFNGVNGARLWSLEENAPNLDWGDTLSVVSTSPTDPVLFVTTGGYPTGGGPFRRVPATLIAFDRSGAILTTWTEPEGRETYSSPAVLELPGGERLIAFGTGGETLAGHLRLLTYDPTMQELTPVAAIPSACEDGGFIASPVFGDLDGDGTPEVVDLDFCGTVHAARLDGTTLWTRTSTTLYGTANPLLADLDGDEAYDVVAAFASTNFSIPATFMNPTSEVIALSGRSGDRLWSWRTPSSLFSSPVSADLDLDDIEDIWLVHTRLEKTTVLSGTTGQVAFELPYGNSSATPVLADVDDDCDLDFFVTSMTRPMDTRCDELRLTFPGRPVRGGSWSGFRGWPVHSGHRY